MNRKKYFEKHYAKLRFEAWLSSLIMAAIFGLFAGFVSAMITWFLAFNGLLLSIGIAVGVTGLLTPLFYFVQFRPNVIKNARRLDRLGLEERLVTMVEYENDDSYIAEVQRTDAVLSLAALSSAAIHLAISTVTVVLLIVASSLFTVANTLEVLAVTGILPGGESFIEEEDDEEMIDYVSVTYEADGGGFFSGEDIQLIPKGTSSTEVVAVADEGWEFYEWDDGYKKPARSDKNITEDVVFIAIFIQTGDGDPQEDPNGEPSDKPSDRPQNTDEEKEEQENPNDSENQQPEDDPKEPSNNGGSKYQEANQVINGETYYKDALLGNTEDGISYYEKLIERLEKEGDKLTEEERYIIESYLGII